jgi:hypothetical protein
MQHVSHTTTQAANNPATSQKQHSKLLISALLLWRKKYSASPHAMHSSSLQRNEVPLAIHKRLIKLSCIDQSAVTHLHLVYITSGTHATALIQYDSTHVIIQHAGSKLQQEAGHLCLRTCDTHAAEAPNNRLKLNQHSYALLLLLHHRLPAAALLNSCVTPCCTLHALFHAPAFKWSK